MCLGSSVAAISAALAARRLGPVYFRIRGNKMSHRKLAINWQLGNFGQKQLQGLPIWKWWIEWCPIGIFFYIWPSLKPEYHFKDVGKRSYCWSCDCQVSLYIRLINYTKLFSAQWTHNTCKSRVIQMNASSKVMRIILYAVSHLLIFFLVFGGCS